MPIWRAATAWAMLAKHGQLQGAAPSPVGVHARSAQSA